MSAATSRHVKCLFGFVRKKNIALMKYERRRALSTPFFFVSNLVYFISTLPTKKKEARTGSLPLRLSLVRVFSCEQIKIKTIGSSIGVFMALAIKKGLSLEQVLGLKGIFRGCQGCGPWDRRRAWLSAGLSLLLSQVKSSQYSPHKHKIAPF